jgi:hypothetical protein
LPGTSACRGTAGSRGAGPFHAPRLAVGPGHVAGQERDRLPLCLDYLALLLDDPAAFWEGMPFPTHLAARWRVGRFGPPRACLSPSGDTSGQPPEGGKKRHPSREHIRYVALPLELHQALERYAESRSDEDDKKSVSWAARVAVRRSLTDQGFWPPKGGKE